MNEFRDPHGSYRRVEDFKKTGFLTTQLILDFALVRGTFDNYRKACVEVYVTEIEDAISHIARRGWVPWMMKAVHDCKHPGMSGSVKELDIEFLTMCSAGRVLITIRRPRNRDMYVTLIAAYNDPASDVGLQGINMKPQTAIRLLWDALQAVDVLTGDEPLLKLKPDDQIGMG